mmetsp:Transcript_51328/g.103184  ORF Transcript_51328/g.103184 Transcript_51328/m.103184 type:complete len:202 (-) Transcript_51328:194-799(-)
MPAIFVALPPKQEARRSYSQLKVRSQAGTEDEPTRRQIHRSEGQGRAGLHKNTRLPTCLTLLHVTSPPPACGASKSWPAARASPQCQAPMLPLRIADPPQLGSPDCRLHAASQHGLTSALRRRPRQPGKMCRSPTRFGRKAGQSSAAATKQPSQCRRSPALHPWQVPQQGAPRWATTPKSASTALCSSGGGKSRPTTRGTR